MLVSNVSNFLRKKNNTRGITARLEEVENRTKKPEHFHPWTLPVCFINDYDSANPLFYIS